MKKIHKKRADGKNSAMEKRFNDEKEFQTATAFSKSAAPKR